MSARSQARVEAQTVAALVVQLNDLLARLQSGMLPLGGLRLDASSTVAPTATPTATEPWIRAATIAGTVTYYHWTGASWTTF